MWVDSLILFEKRSKVQTKQDKDRSRIYMDNVILELAVKAMSILEKTMVLTQGEYLEFF